MKSKIIILLIVLSTSCFSQSKEMYQKIGDSLLDKKDYTAMITYFKAELKKYPKNEDVLRWLGYSYLNNNELELGKKYYTEALKVNPKCGKCYLNIGRVYAIQEKNVEALEYFKKAITATPNDATIYSTRASLREVMGDGFFAFLDYEKAIELEPNNYKYYINRAEYSAKTGDLNAASNDYNKAVTLAPDNYLPYFRRASFYFSLKDYDKALSDTNNAIKLDSTRYDLYTGRGAIFEAINQYKEAVKNHTKAMELKPDEFLPYLNRATANYKLENLDSACKDYKVLEKLINSKKLTDKAIIQKVQQNIQDFCNPTKPSYYYQRGIAFYNLKKFQKAVEMYNIGLKKFPSNSMTLAFKGNALMALEKYEEAINSYKEALKHKDNTINNLKTNPRLADASNTEIEKVYKASVATNHFNIAESYIYLGNLDQALLEINTAIELAPDGSPARKEAFYNVKGHILILQKKYNEAITAFSKSIVINPNFDTAYINRAIAKICALKRIKVNRLQTQKVMGKQPLLIDWEAPKKSVINRIATDIQSALLDCHNATKINPSNGYAYYIQGKIKQLSLRKDYCSDFLQAKELGLTIQPSLIQKCY